MACRPILLLTLAALAALAAQDASAPIADPVVEPSTMHSIAVRWLIRGDDDENARIAVHYRATDAKDWREAQPLWRVQKGASTGLARDKTTTLVAQPADGWIFAGSVLFLAPATTYEVRLTLDDADGGAVEKTVTATTTAQPTLPKDLTVRHVVPGDGGGDGSEAAPFKGLAAANAAAKPGDCFVLAAGTYPAPFEPAASGEPGHPIVWSGPVTGDAIIDAKGAERAVSASNRHDLWFRKLTVVNATWGMVLHESYDVVVTRCVFTGCKCGITGTRNPNGVIHHLFVADNVLDGVDEWILPFDGNAKGDEQWHQEFRGIELSGTGNEICYNRVSHFKDAIDVTPSDACCDCDLHHNDVSEDIDDSIEMDGTERNNRCWLNRCTDSHTGISVQPVFGGPCYIVRNTIYNTHSEALKMHNQPSGVIFVHNTTVKCANAFTVSTGDRIHATLFRDNLFVGTAERAFNLDVPPDRFDADYDGYGGWSGGVFLKFNDVKYATPDEVRARCPIEKHCAIVDPATLFASGVQPPTDPHPVYPHDLDLRLKAGSAAIDAGTPMANLDDGFVGEAPDLGAFELGAELPHYGPRPEGEGAGEAGGKAKAKPKR